MAMASAFPQTPAEFMQIVGVGERKAEVYGEQFIEAIREYVGQHGIDGARTVAPPKGRIRYREVGEAFASGKPIAELQEQWRVGRSTILSHLVDFKRYGGMLDAERVLV
jgi:ATP-dependent DNA helicase RecQ